MLEPIYLSQSDYGDRINELLDAADMTPEQWADDFAFAMTLARAQRELAIAGIFNENERAVVETIRASRIQAEIAKAQAEIAAGATIH